MTNAESVPFYLEHQLDIYISSLHIHFIMFSNDVASNFQEIHDCLKICFTPLRGIEPRPRRWKRRILATRPQGMVPFQIGKSSIFLTRQKLFRKGCAYLWGCLSFYRTLGVLERVFSERLLKETVRIGVFLSHYKTYSRAGNRTPAAAVRAPNPSH